MKRKKILILYTGGTIGGDLTDVETGGVIEAELRKDQFEKEFKKIAPDLNKEVDWQIRGLGINKFSEHMTPSDWVQIARGIHETIVTSKNGGVDGIVVAHGTDTLAYTAAAVSFMLPGLEIPVVITGSNYPLMHPKSDAARNLYDAIFVARHESMDGVYVVFSGVPEECSTIHLGTRVRKIAFEGNCFASINTEPIGVIQRKKSLLGASTKDSIKFLNEPLFRAAREARERVPFQLLNRVNGNIAFLAIYPGFYPEKIQEAIKSDPGGIILDLYNSGTSCTKGEYSLIPAIEEAVRRNIPVFVTSQHIGSVEMDIYGSSVELRKAGAVPLHDMIREAAIPKLMWVRGQIPDKFRMGEVVKMMLQNAAGELSEK